MLTDSGGSGYKKPSSFTGGTSRRAPKPAPKSVRSTRSAGTPSYGPKAPQNIRRAPAPAPRRAVQPTPAPRRSAPAPRANFGNWSASPIPRSSGGGGGGRAVAPAAPAAPPKPSQKDYLGSDPGFIAQQAALARALGDYQANYNTDLSHYNTDYGQAVKNLGYSMGVDNPATPQNEALSSGLWDHQDQNTASGRAFQNQQNDFSGRGMLQSSLYATALSNLQRSLGDQLSGIDTAKTNYTQDQSRKLTTYKGENTSALQQAKADAMSRYAAIYGNL